MAGLTREHGRITDIVKHVLARTSTREIEDVDAVRRLGTNLLGLLVSHGQRGSDLFYEAHEVNVGGET